MNIRWHAWLYTIYAVLLASAFGLGLGSDASAAGGNVRFIVGMATTEATISEHPDPCGTTYWHCDEEGRPNQTALDLTNTSGATNGAAVWLQAWSTPGTSAYARFTAFPPGQFCPEIRATILIEVGGSWISPGTVDYILLTNFQVATGTEIWLGSGWTFVQLGNIGMASGCGNPHLHQSGTHNPPYMWTNWPADGDDDPSISGHQINLTGDTSYNFLHQVTW